MRFFAFCRWGAELANGDVHRGDLKCSLCVDSGRTIVDFLRPNLRHDHARHFRIKPADAIAANNKVRRIEHVAFDGVATLAFIHFRSLGLHQVENEFRRSVVALVHYAYRRIISLGNGLDLLIPTEAATFNEMMSPLITR